MRNEMFLFNRDIFAYLHSWSLQSQTGVWERKKGRDDISKWGEGSNCLVHKLRGGDLCAPLFTIPISAHGSQVDEGNEGVYGSFFATVTEYIGHFAHMTVLPCLSVTI